MPKYTVCYSIIGSGAVEIEAETPEAAAEAAYGEADTTVCHYCASKISDPEIGEVTAVTDEHGEQLWPAPESVAPAEVG